MPNVTKSGKISRKILPIIYVLDTSGSMVNARISAVNSAMIESIDVLKDISKTNPSAEIKIGVLTFDANFKWVTPEDELVFMQDFYWNNLEAGGTTNLADALNELYKKLSRSAYFTDEIGYKLPVIIFMSDGEPDDKLKGGVFYKPAIYKLMNHNNWFKHATKIAFAIDNECDKDVLAELTGSEESVIAITDMVTFKKLIRVVSATVALIGSKSRTDADLTDQIMEEIRSKMEGESGVDIKDKMPDDDPPTSPVYPDSNDRGWNPPDLSVWD